MNTSPNKSDDVRQFYLALSDRQKVTFLAILSNSLTIDGRDFVLTRAGTSLIRSLEGLNELQHQISQHIGALTLGSKRYPDEVLWQILIEKAESHGIIAALERSFKFVRSRSTWSGQESGSEAETEN